MSLPERLRDRLSRALERRRTCGLAADGETTAFRLIDGAGDGWNGVEIDVWGPDWVVSTREAAWPDGLESAVPEFCRSIWWRVLDPRERRPPRCVAGTPPASGLTVQELGLTYETHLASGWSQGLFPDQREQRVRLMRDIRPGETLLNLFAYTGAFSVAAASRGAVTTTVDLSQPYLAWSKRNFRLNGLDPDKHFFCRGDAHDWLRRFAAKQRVWDWIILDPPTFSRNDKGRVFRVETGLTGLVTLCCRVLAPGGRLLVSTNHRGTSAAALASLVTRAAADAGITRPGLTPGSMPPDFPGPEYLRTLWLTRPA